MIRALLLTLTIALAARGGQNTEPYNTMIDSQTIYLDSTEVKWSKIFWQDDGAEKYMLWDVYDDSAAGYVNDSISFEVRLYGAVKDGDGVVRLVQDASADSLPFDTLSITDMDSTLTYALVRAPIKSIQGDTIGWTYTDTLDSVSALYGWHTGKQLAPESSSGIVFKYTGFAGNKSNGVGVKIRQLFYQLIGTKVKD